MTKAYVNFTSSADAALVQINQVITRQQVAVIEENAAIRNDVAVNLNAVNSQFSDPGNQLTGDILSFTASLATPDAAIKGFWSNTINRKVNDINALKVGISKARTDLNALVAKLSGDAQQETNSLISNFNLANGGFFGMVSQTVGTATSAVDGQLSRVKGMIRQFRVINTGAPFLAAVRDYNRRVFGWLQAMCEYDMRNIINYQNAISSQFDQLYFNYLNTAQQVAQATKVLTNNAQFKLDVVTKVFDKKAWTPVAAVPSGLLPAGFENPIMVVFKTLLKAFDANLAATSNNYRFVFRNADTSFGFAAFGIYQADSDGIYCYVATDNPDLAKGQLSCSLEYSWDVAAITGIPAHAPAAISPVNFDLFPIAPAQL